MDAAKRQENMLRAGVLRHTENVFQILHRIKRAGHVQHAGDHHGRLHGSAASGRAQAHELRQRAFSRKSLLLRVVEKQ